jgi:hypothetical protein
MLTLCTLSLLLLALSLLSCTYTYSYSFLACTIPSYIQRGIDLQPGGFHSFINSFISFPGFDLTD